VDFIEACAPLRCPSLRVWVDLDFHGMDYTLANLRSALPNARVGFGARCTVSA
jgi:hypothetical protein